MLHGTGEESRGQEREAGPGVGQPCKLSDETRLDPVNAAGLPWPMSGESPHLRPQGMPPPFIKALSHCGTTSCLSLPIGS